MSGVNVAFLEVSGGPLMIIFDPEGRILLWNRACEELTGYLFEEVHGRLLWEALSVPAGAEQIRKAIQQVAEGGTPRPSETCWRTKAGEERWVAWSPSVTRGIDGRVEFIVEIGIDKTDVRRAQEALRLSEAKYAGIVSIAADAIISIDEEQRIVIYNKGAEEIFGYSCEEVLGRPIDMLIPERFRDAHREHIRRFAQSPWKSRRMGESGREIFGLRRNSQEFHADAAISRLEVYGTRIFTVVLRDITEQKRNEKEQHFLAEIGEL